MKLSEHVYFYQAPDSTLRRGSVNGNTMIIKGRRMMLVDPGGPMGANLKKVEREMSADGLDMAKVSEIWITHAHPDHAAAAPVLQDRLHVPVRCSAVDVEIMRRPEIYIELERRAAGAFINKVFPYPDWMVSAFFWWFWDRWTAVEDLNPFNPDETIDVGTEVRVIPLPGHCKGEIGFFLPEDGTLISGDLINYGKYELPSINMPGSSITDAMASLNQIKRLDPVKMAPAHNKPLLNQEAVRRIIDSALSCCESVIARVREMLMENPAPSMESMTTRLFHNLPTIHIFERPSLTFAILKHLNALDKVSP